MTAASIVVCTHNRRDLLQTCLESLVADSSVVDRELLVVDNASTDGTSEYLSGFVDGRRSLPIRVVHESAIGHSNARNRGLRETSSEVVLFTDDDVKVCDGWADALVAPFEEPSVLAVGGRVVPDWAVEPPRWLHGPHAEVVTLRDYGTTSRRLEAGELPIGANMAIRRNAITDDAFDPRLGHRGSSFMAFDEVELMDRLRTSGVLWFAADAVVHHHVAAIRMTWTAMKAQHFGMGVGQGTLRRTRTGARVMGAPLRASRVIGNVARCHFDGNEEPITSEEAETRLALYHQAGYALGVAPRPLRRLRRALEKIAVGRAQP